jgi:transcriptional regulator with XRE-family HTH domain
MTTATPTIGEDFSLRMERLGVTQEFLGEFTGLSQSAISKAVNELTDSQRSKINAALRELEEISALFYPQKLWFEDAKATREWINSPQLPCLFAVFSARIAAPSLDESWQESVRRDWLDFLEASKHAQSNAASI